MTDKTESIRPIYENKPLVFTKKVNNNYKIIPLNKTNNTLGPNRHFPVANKEWFNSIYTYNKNSLTNFTVSDKKLINLVESYFNLYFSNRILKHKRIVTRVRRLDFNKIFVGKPELKHTNNKVIINLHVFNQQKIYLRNKLKILESILFPTSKYLSFIHKKNVTVSIPRLKRHMPVSIAEKLLHYNKELNMYSLIKYLEELSSKVSTEIILEQENLILIRKNKEIREKLLYIEGLENYLIKINSILPQVKTLSLKTNNFENKCNDLYINFMCKILLDNEIETISKYKLLLNLNRSKFENNFIIRLKMFIKRIYNKEVELNIVNLKSLYLDIGIFTQAIAKKLKNRDNRIVRILRNSLLMVKLPIVNTVKQKYGKSFTNQSWVNKIKDLQVNSFVSHYKNNNDSLNEILLNTVPNPGIYYTETKNITFNPEKLSLKETITSKNIQDIVFKSLKDKIVGGIRLEARGRLSKRFTASRKIFKVRWKGSLKNIDSSYRGLSSIILRGHLKSNVQYYNAVNKNRIGAYGIKGWISGK